MRLLVLTCALACSALADIHTLGDLSPISAGFNSGGVADYVRGWRFQANANVTVTELGAFTPHPEGSPFSVVLWDFNAQSILASRNFVSDGLDVWQWQNLSSPVNLTSGSQYIVSVFSTVGNYYYQAIGGPWQPTGTIQYLDMRYANSATVNTFPTNVLSGYQYGVPDIGYHLTPTGAVPEPSTYALFTLAGVAGLLAKRRIRRP